MKLDFDMSTDGCFRFFFKSAGISPSDIYYFKEDGPHDESVLGNFLLQSLNVFLFCVVFYGFGTYGMKLTMKFATNERDDILGSLFSAR